YPPTTHRQRAVPRRLRVIMPHTFRSDRIQECYLRAAEARRIANDTTDPITKADFVALGRRWLSLARRYESDERRSAGYVQLRVFAKIVSVMTRPSRMCVVAPRLVHAMRAGRG